MLLGAWRRLTSRGGELRVVARQPWARVFEKTRTDRLLAVHPTREQAATI